MREYAHWQTSMLLRRLANELGKAAKSGKADAIHDLRVAIRRMNGCLRLFAQFYADRPRKQLHQELKTLMRASGEVRDRDIAMALLADAGVPPSSAVARRLGTERKDAAHELRGELKRWKSRGLLREWRKRLEL
ncbi:MAG: CHAD domain-containing protein [Bryobacteraceae bacterium]